MKKNIAAIVVVIVCLVLVSFPWINSRLYEIRANSIENEVQIRVTWKERVSYGDIFQQHYYLIYGELADGTPCVLQNTDARLRDKYNGSDIYQRIEIGRVYTFFVVGEREPKRARYPNIIEIVDAQDDWDTE